MKQIYKWALCFFFSASIICAQTSFPELYLKGKEELKANNIPAAEKSFYQSIMRNKDIDSYYQLGKLYYTKREPTLKNQGYEYSAQALRLSPDNLDYNYLYLDYLKSFGGKDKREREYWKIFNGDHSQALALFKIAEIRFNTYEEYRALKVDTELWLKDEDVIPFDLTEFVKTDLDTAESLYLRGLKIDSTNYFGLFGIVKMYQSTTKPEKAIEYLERIRKYYPYDKDVHLQLGVYYYKKRRLDDSFKELQLAVELMGGEEKEDFVYNSAVKLLEPKYLEVFKKMNKGEKSILIEKLWKSTDPLYLSDYNERIMEHYARVAYANLFYSVPNIDLKGWMSDRGQVLIRYGEPAKKQKLRQSRNSGIKNTGTIVANENIIIAGDMVGTFVEIWEYENLPGFLFTGDVNYYKFVVNNEVNELWRNKWMKRTVSSAAPSALDSRNAINSLQDYENVKRQVVQTYKPVLYGSRMNLDSRMYSFKKLTPGAGAIVETYMAYSMPTKDTSNINNVKDYTHEIGIFVFDEYLNTIIEKRSTYKDAIIRKVFKKNKENMVNCVYFDLNSRKVSFAFDLRRMLDSNYFTYRRAFEIPKYEDQAVSISDLVTTNGIDFEKPLPFGIRRGEISFYPNLNNKFRIKEQFFIYYEAYNLKKDGNNETNFEQVITIRPKGEEGISLKKLVKGITTLFSGEDGAISLTTNYRTNDENTQVYMQLDLSGYKPGKYDFIITINDKISGISVERKTDLEIY